MIGGYLRVAPTYEWAEVPCRITRSAVVAYHPVPNVPARYRLEVAYEYTFDGRSFEGTRFHSRERMTNSREKAESWQQAYPADSGSVCYVNPENPQEALLRRDSRAMLYTIWFPGLFLVGGLVMTWRALFARQPDPA